MSGKWLWRAAIMTALVASVGCGTFCERWCGAPRVSAVAPVAPVCYQPAPLYCYPAPAAQAAPAPVQPAGGWTQPAVPCVPCR